MNIYPNLYKIYFLLENGVKVIYVKLQKAQYRLPCIKLLFYLKLATNLKNNGFVINPYDLCVEKKLVKREAMTVAWHVENLKVSHKDLFEVTKCDQYLSTIYSNKLKVHRGKIHEYLGMDLGYLETGAVKFSMIKIPTKGPRQVSRRVERDIGHPDGVTSVPSNRGG